MLAIVPRHVRTDSADIFVGSFSSQTPPPRVALRVDGVERLQIDSWTKIDGGLAEPIFWWSGRLAELMPGRLYALSIETTSAVLAEATVETLPRDLPEGELGAGVDRPFTIWLSSCYCVRNSPKGLGRTIERTIGNPRLRPHIKCLVGDQVYLDELSLFIYSALSERRLRTRFNEQYARTWDHPEFSRLLGAGANFFLPDDHEFWNNFPDTPFGIPLRGPGFWRAWIEQANRARCVPIQNPARVESFAIGDALSVFIADMRSDRSPHTGCFMSEGGIAGVPPASGNIDALCRWLERLRCPGILVTQQPILAAAGGVTDRKLPDYPQYWRRLLPALHACTQDVVVLSGDSHHGLVASATAGLPGNPHRIIQVVSSPLALVSPIAASIPRGDVHWLPPAEPDFMPSPVEYPLRVPTYRSAGVLRTEEHAMSVSFWKRRPNAIGMRVRTWLARGATQQIGPSFETTLRVRRDYSSEGTPKRLTT